MHWRRSFHRRLDILAQRDTERRFVTRLHRNRLDQRGEKIALRRFYQLCQRPDIRGKPVAILVECAGVVARFGFRIPCGLQRRFRRGRRLAQFTDVGNVLDTGYGGFPNALYRGWNPLQTFPTSCFTIGLMNPLYLAQCFAFTTSF